MPGHNYLFQPSKLIWHRVNSLNNPELIKVAMAGHKLLPAFLDMITLFGALFGSIGSGMLLALFARNDGFKMFYRRGNGGKHMRAVVFGCFLSGLFVLKKINF